MTVSLINEEMEGRGRLLKERVGKVPEEVTGSIGGVIVRYFGATLITQVVNFRGWHYFGSAERNHPWI